MNKSKDKKENTALLREYTINQLCNGVSYVKEV